MKNKEYKHNNLKITVRHGDENRARVESIYNETDIFYQSYLHAVLAIERITESAEKFERDNNSHNLLGYSNNMVLFSAERGGGKTSAMVSFGKALQEIQEKKEKEKAEQLWETRVLDSRFCVLDSIDPTFMEKRDSILKMVLSRLFVRFREQWDLCMKNGTSEELNTKKENIMELFRKCYRNIEVLKQNDQKENIYDDLYYLEDLGDSANLKRSYFTLINKFLEFVEISKGKQYLVIQIDDVDLNAEKAYDILEDLRKYLMLPNVIILLSADLRQLRQALENKYINDYKDVLRYQGSMDPIECRNMAERYIEKVFPVIQQIHLPQISRCINADREALSVEYIGETSIGENNFQNLLLYNDSNGVLVRTYQPLLLRIIYEKTGVIITERDNLHELLPQKMRELTHFLEYFCAMKSYDGGFSWIESFKYYYDDKVNESSVNQQMETKLWTWYENLKRFEEYLGEYWGPYYLDQGQQKLYKEILNASSRNQSKEVRMLLIQYLLEHKIVQKDIRSWSMQEIEAEIQLLSRKERGNGNKFNVLLLVYFSIYRSKMLLYDLLNDKHMDFFQDMLGGEKVVFSFPKNEMLFEGCFPLQQRKLNQVRKENFPEKDMVGLLRYMQNYTFIKEGQLYFNIFGPFTQCLQDSETIYIIGNRDKETYEKNMEQMGSLIQILINSDLKAVVQEELENLDLELEKNLISPTGIMKRIYESIDSCVERYSNLNLRSNTKLLFAEEQTRQNPYISLFFICNKTLSSYYLRMLSRELQNRIPGKITSKASDEIDKYNEVLENVHVAQMNPQAKITDFGLDEIMLADRRIRDMFDMWNEKSRQLQGVLNEIVDAFDTLGEKRNKKIIGIDDMIQRYNKIIDDWRLATENFVGKEE